MKKKIVGIFVCILMISSIISINTSGKTVDDINSIYPISMTQDFFNSPYLKNLPELDPNEASLKPTIGDPPKEFSWRNYQGRDWISPAKNQEPLGTCYVFAAMGALESVINIREENADLDLDLSEQYVISCLPSAGSAWSGGVAFQAYKYIMDTSPEGNNYNGIIPETCFPYQGKDGVSCSEKCDDWVDHLIPIHGYGFWIPDGSPEDRDRIKTQILEKGPVIAGLCVIKMFQRCSILFHNPSFVFSTLQKTSGVNHEAVLVGWKDDPKIMNGGYWIVKNSWGADWGDNGFFNIAYGCLGIDKECITWVEYDSPSIDSLPVADAGGPYVGYVGQDILFDARNSFDSEGAISSYEWDFGDGSKYTGETPTHIYSKGGAYVVNLTVTDESGQQDSDEIFALIDFWQIGDSWKFNVNFYIDFSVDGKRAEALGFSSNDFVFRVVGETDDTYFLECDGTGSGFMKLFLFKAPVNSVSITGNMVLRKKDLWITSYNMTYDGEIGLLQIPITAMMNTEFNPSWQIFPFPFYADEVYCLTTSNITHNASMKIGNAKVSKYNYFYLQYPFYCLCEEKVITVPAGTYSTFHIKNLTDPFNYYQFEYYYSPDVRNIVKFSMIYNKYPSVSQQYFVMDLELVSYTYHNK